MIVFVFIAVLLFVLGLLIRDAHLTPESFWVPLGSFLHKLAIILFIVMILWTAIGETATK